MATDLQTVFPQDQIPLSQVAQVPGLAPRTLRVVGQDFSAVAEVQLNGVTSPSVVILNRNVLLAQVPKEIVGDTISSVSVLSATLTLTASSLLNFELGPRSQKVNGLLKLVQVFVKILFTTPGRDIFSPNLGGGGLRNLGQSFDSAQGKGIVADFFISVSNTTKQLTALQARSTRLPRAERLLSATVISANFNAQEAALIASMSIMSQTGQSALANLTL